MTEPPPTSDEYTCSGRMLELRRRQAEIGERLEQLRQRRLLIRARLEEPVHPSGPALLRWVEQARHQAEESHQRAERARQRAAAMFRHAAERHEQVAEGLERRGQSERATAHWQAARADHIRAGALDEDLRAVWPPP